MTGVEKIQTFINEYRVFTETHTDLNDVKLNLGGMAWGFMRAIAECPNCPGVFRIPDNEDWDHLYCPSCHEVWTHKSLIPKNELSKYQ